MDVRRPVRFVCALALIAPLLVGSVGCGWLLKGLLEGDTPPERDASGPDLAQLWEDGYGYNNPNAELIRTGKKKRGETPQKGKNPFYREKERDDRSSAKKNPEFTVEEPEFDFR